MITVDYGVCLYVLEMKFSFKQFFLVVSGLLLVLNLFVMPDYKEQIS